MMGREYPSMHWAEGDEASQTGLKVNQKSSHYTDLDFYAKQQHR